MRGMPWLAAVVVAFFGLQPLLAQTLSADEIVTRMIVHDAARKAALSEYVSERSYHLEYTGPIGERAAQMQVRMQFSAPDRKQFTVESESGSTIFCHQILSKLMEGEREGALDANRLLSMISPENDHLKLVGDERLDGEDAWVLDVAPKHENSFNYKGRIWVNKSEFAVMRIVGSPARNPTWLVGSSSFDYRYRQRGVFWLPERNDTMSRLRIGGEIKLTVEYGQYRIVTVAPPAGADSGTKGEYRSGSVDGMRAMFATPE